MNVRQKNTALVAAIVSGIISLPLTWMTISTPLFPNSTGGSIPFPLPIQVTSQFEVTAFNGSVTFLVTTPIWLVVCIAIAASVIQFMRQSRAFEIPSFVVWGVAIVALVWTTLPVLIAVFSGGASPSIGWLFGLICAALPLACLIFPTKGAAAVSA